MLQHNCQKICPTTALTADAAKDAKAAEEDVNGLFATCCDFYRRHTRCVWSSRRSRSRSRSQIPDPRSHVQFQFLIPTLLPGPLSRGLSSPFEVRSIRNVAICSDWPQLEVDVVVVAAAASDDDYDDGDGMGWNGYGEGEGDGGAAQEP
ncbi:GD10585 [Drosophila simulans]|uniref:GD10585 n=1 Tax=Drosophila simulans TaxID=7240 RepID=B4QG63_DROSI|nr:GD10585 [Drosophila simulans]